MSITVNKIHPPNVLFHTLAKTTYLEKIAGQNVLGQNVLDSLGTPKLETGQWVEVRPIGTVGELTLTETSNSEIRGIDPMARSNRP